MLKALCYNKTYVAVQRMFGRLQNAIFRKIKLGRVAVQRMFGRLQNAIFRKIKLGRVAVQRVFGRLQK